VDCGACESRIAWQGKLAGFDFTLPFPNYFEREVSPASFSASINEYPAVPRAV
jgi:hypothetical protein